MRTFAKKSLCVLLTMALLITAVAAVPGSARASAANRAAQTIINIAKGQAGNGGSKYQAWWGSYVAWCCLFVSWSVYQADRQLGTNMYGTIVPKTASCGTSRSFYVNNGRYKSRGFGYTPQPGDFVYFNWQSSGGRPQHIGIVTGVSGGKVYTIEGNSGKRVANRSYSLSSSKILGYGRPNYSRITGGSDTYVEPDTTASSKSSTTTTKRSTTQSASSSSGSTATTTRRTTTTTTAPETTTARPTLRLNTDNVELAVERSVALSADLRNAAQGERTLKWTSSNADVAKVSQEGVITALSDGTATITVKSGGGLTASCDVTVKNPTRDISLNFETSNIYEGTELQLTAIIEPENTTDTMEWTSSDEAIATVSEEGLVTAVAIGEAVIKVESSSGKSAECKLTVDPAIVMIEDMVLDKDFESVNEGDTFVLNVATDPIDATELISWESSNEDVVTVDQEGKVTAVGGGTATITVSSDSGITATCIVTVKVPTKSVYFEQSSVTLTPGYIHKMVPVLSESDTTDVLIWYCDDPTVAVVSPDGEVIAISSGIANVRVETSGGVSAECSVSIL